MKARFVFGLTVLALCSGCGTIARHMPVAHPDGVMGPYCGVRHDVHKFAHGHYLWILDVPFSALADTLMLPCDWGDEWGTYREEPELK